MNTIVPGLLAVTVLLVSVCLLRAGKPLGGLACSVSAFPLIYCTGYGWRAMLINSGKGTALLGFSRYPAAPIILATLSFAALVLLSVSLAALFRRTKK